MNNKKLLALNQAFLLVMGIFAIAFIIGGMNVVSAGEDEKAWDELKNTDSKFKDAMDYYIKKKIYTEDQMFSTWKSQVDVDRTKYVESIKDSYAEDLAAEEEAKKQTEDPSKGKDLNGGNSDADGKEKKSGVVEKAGTIGIGMLGNALKSSAGKKLGLEKKTDAILNKIFPKGTEKLTQKEIEKKLIAEGVDKKAAKTLSKEAAKEASRQARFEAAKSGGFGKQLWYVMTHTKNVGEMSAGAQITGTLLSSAIAAGIVYAAFKIAGAGERNMKSVATSAIVAVGTVSATNIALTLITSTSALGGPITMAITAAIMVFWQAFSYQDYSQDTFTFSPKVWQPPIGGENCLKCNDFRYGCSEYQCRSLGQACEIINQGTTDEKCVWINENDIKPPTISPLFGALKNQDDYTYIETTSALPEERGVKIVYKPNSDGCIPPYTDISFGVETDEPAYCKIDMKRQPNFEEMLSDMLEGNLKVYNHTLMLPGSGMTSSDALEAFGLEIINDQSYAFFIKCQDANGNANNIDFLMEFCIDETPDVMAPVIESTNFLAESYIQFNQTFAPLEVVTNEPADCKWDFQDLDYEVMANNMTECSQNPGEYMFPQTYSYGCVGEISGIREGADNNYYIRCKDKPWWNESMPGRRVTNSESYVLTLKGSYPLQIDSVTVNDKESGATIVDSINTVQTTLKVKTSAGANEGLSRCKYGIDGSFYDFYNDGSFEFLPENTQDLFLPEGFYIYEIQCIDEAGNLANSTINFTIDMDEEAPLVTRIYYEEGQLKISTNEEAECVYSTFDCNYPFEDGSVMNHFENMDHFVEWTTDIDLYIKCKDQFGNIPIPQSECSIVARAFEEQKI